jgi:glutamate synthase domain-containing protein 2
MNWIRNIIPFRYFAWLGSGLAFVGSLLLLWLHPLIGSTPVLIFGALTILGALDFFQTKQAIRRNYPILAHFRFFLESIRPEIRQYFFESDTDNIPFSRAQRSLVYQRAKNVIDKKAYGTLTDVYKDQYEWINHSVQTVPIKDHNFRVMIGEGSCKQPYSLSIYNISAMSFGALSGNAILALNKGAKLGGFAHDTGEGSISRYHRENGGDLIWEIGSGYFGCRNQDGSFSAERFAENACDPQVKMIEIKLSQGAKPGHGGILPAAKVTKEIAEARGVPEGVDCVSPSCHSAFSTPVELMHFIAKLRDLSGGKPVGFKLCIGHPWEFFAICKAMIKTNITPDYIVVDGAEGGTAAAPVEFTDHLGTPMHEGLVLVHNTLVGLNLRDRVKIGAGGKVISAFDIARTMALGADWCNSGRGFMFALGCLMAQTCHTGRCPTGVATQSWLRQRALDPDDKGNRVYHFHHNTLKALAEIVGAAGLSHPNQLRPHHIVRRVSMNEVSLVSALIDYLKPGDLLENRAEHPVYRMFWRMASPDSFSPIADCKLPT